MRLNYSQRDIINYYRKIKNLALKAELLGDFNLAVDYLQISAKFAYELNFIYSDLESEALIKKLSSKKFKKSNVENDSERIVFYDAFGWDNRGLTQQYIGALIANSIKFLYVFEKKDANSCFHILQQLNNYGEGVEIWELSDTKSELEKAEELHNKILDYQPSKIFMHLAPWSVMALIVFHAFPNVVKYNINLTDHAFWLGTDCLDYNIEFRNYGAAISRLARNIEEKRILYLPYYPIINKNDFRGFPEQAKDKIILFSGGAFYKIYGSKGKYLILVKRLLEIFPNIIIIYAGNGDDTIIKKFITNNNFENRLILVGHRNDINEVFENCDIYLSTFPFTGGLMTQYAAYNEKPILSYYDKSLGIGKAESVLSRKENIDFSKYSEVDFYNYAEKLINDLQFRTKEGQRINRALIKISAFNHKFKDLLDGKCKFSQLDEEQIDFIGVRSIYLEIVNKFTRKFEKMLVHKLGFKSLFLCPKCLINYLPIYLKNKISKYL